MPALTVNDLNNAKLDCDTIAAIATSTAATTTDRAGNIKPTMKGVVDGLNAQAAITETGVNRAAAQAGAAASNTAAGVAAGAARLYVDDATGLAATAEGGYYSIPSGLSDEAAVVKRKVSGVAVDTGKRTPSAGATVSQKNLSEFAATELPALRNLFDRVTASDSFAIRATDGVAEANSGFFATAFIKVLPGGQFVLNRDIFGNGGTYGIAFYTVNRVFIAGSGLLGVKTAGTAISVPSDSAYVRFSVSGLPNKNGMQMVHGSVLPTAFRDHDLTDKYSQRAEWAARLSDTLRSQPNLFDASAATIDTAVSSITGSTSASSGFFATQYMPVSPGTVVCDRTSSGSAGFGWAFYDPDKVFISGIAGPIVAGAVVTVPFGAAFTRFCMQMSVSSNAVPRYAMQVCQGSSVPAAYRAAGYADDAGAANIAQILAKGYGPASQNLFDVLRATQGFALSSSNVLQATAGFCVSDSMPVLSGGTLITNLDISLGAGFGIGWYDRNRNYLSSTPGGMTAGVAVTAPQGACYARMSCLSSDARRRKFTTDAVMPPLTALGWQDLLAQFRWAGKVFSIAGDSIVQTTDGSRIWRIELLYRLKMSLGVDAGHSGYKMHQMFQDDAVSTFSTTNLCLVAYGTNDYGAAGAPTALGTISDAPATGSGATFIAAMKYNIETLLTAYPTIRLAFATPMQRFGGGAFGPAGTTPNSAGFTLLNYVDAIIAVCALYSLPVLDQYRGVGINALTQSTYLLDTLHPNQLGYTERVIPYSARFLELFA